MCSSNPDMNFYDINEDSAAKKKEWHLELGSDIDITVTDQFSVDTASKRVTLAAATAVYALKFPTSAALQMFESEYNSRLFENTYGMKYDDKNRDQVMIKQKCMHTLCQHCGKLTCYMPSVCQVFGKDNVLTLGGETAESRQQWADDMDVDVSFSHHLAEKCASEPQHPNNLAEMRCSCCFDLDTTVAVCGSSIYRLH